MRTGTTTLPLHGGAAPRWLFARMVALSKEIFTFIVGEFGPQEALARLADPVWFQSLGCVLGFDWHSSGLTTTTTGAIKEGLKDIGPDLGIFIAGGKGRASRKTPAEILSTGEKYALARQPETLVYASRLSAKVDNTAVDDGYQLYHHCFVFTRQGDWAVIQQGMNETNGRARRYHWLWTPQSKLNFVNEPHAGVISEERARNVLNMVARESEHCRQICTALSGEPPHKIIKEIDRIKELELPDAHGLSLADLLPASVQRVLLKTYENPPSDFESLLSTRGLGPKSLRALALLSELLYGVPASRQDPARYSFAHGGKDGIPYPVDRANYDRSIEILREAVARAKIGDTERKKALARLARRA